MMTPKETIVKAFEGGKPERVPVTLFGGGMWSIKDYGTSFEELSHDVDKMVTMCVAEAERVRSDVVYVGSGFNNFHAAALGAKFGAGIKYREIGAPDMTDHFIHSEEDINKLDIQDIFKHPVVKTVMDATLKVKEKIGDTYLVTMTCWGPFTLAARFVGEEDFMKATFKKPAFVEKMVDFCADLLITLYEPLVNAGLEAIAIADPTASGDLINPKQMARFAVPPLRKISDWAKSKGVHTILHICGNTGDRLEQFIDTGCTTIFFDQKVDIAKAKEVLFGKMSFGGNVAPVHVMMNKTKEEVEQACREVIEIAGKDGGFILVPGCDIPPTISYENLKAFHDVALNWKY
ncbi:MAG: uroporphyrinogen decarboxylase family protein [Thermodesulfovibrionales bacterium]